MKSSLPGTLLVWTILLTAAVLVFELVARRVLSLKQQRAIFAETRDVFNWHPDHLVFDRDLGFAMRPDVRYVIRNRESSFRIEVNSQGLRDDEVSSESPALVMLGDSFVFGTGVEKDETTGDQLERLTGEIVLNAGVAQYGTLQELRFLSKHLDRWKEPPRRVFLLFYHGNDLINNVRTSDLRFRPFVERVEDSWQVIEPTRNDYERWQAIYQGRRHPTLSRYSFTAYLATKTWRRLTGFRSERVRMVSPDPEQALAALEYLMADFSRQAPDVSQRLTFVSIPARFFYEQAAYVERYERELERIRGFLEDSDYGFIDLAPELEITDYFRLDGHWRPIGHRKVAELLAAEMR